MTKMNVYAKKYTFKRLFGECVGLGIFVLGGYAGLSFLLGAAFMDDFSLILMILMLVVFVAIGYANLGRKLDRK